MYATDVTFDTAIFDSRVVTGASIINIVDDISRGSYTKLRVYNKSGTALVSASHYSSANGAINAIKSAVSAEYEYRTQLHYSKNGTVDGIIIEEVRR